MEGDIPSGNPNRVLLARSLFGQYVQIKIDDNRPKTFKVSLDSSSGSSSPIPILTRFMALQSEQKRLMWDAATARNAQRLKAQIEMGEYIPDSIRKQLEANKPDLTEAEKKRVKKDSSLLRKRGKLR